MASKPSTLGAIWGTVVDPGGDPAAIRRSADACRALSTELSNQIEGLGATATGLEPMWQSSTGHAFQAAWKKFDATMATYNKHLNDAGDSLDKVADAVHEAQIQARNFKIMVAVTIAAGVANTIWTLGASDAAAIAAVDVEAGVVAMGLAELSAAVAGEAAAVSALVSAIEVTVAKFLLGAGLSLVATVGVKGILQGQNVLDPANYTAKDATNLLIGGTLTMGMGTLANTGKISAALEAHPILGAGAAGVLGGGTGSTIGQVWLNHASLLDWGTLKAIGLSAGIAGTAGLGIGAAAQGVSKGLGAIRTGEGALDSPNAGVLGPNGRQLTFDGMEEPSLSGPLLGPDGEPLTLGSPGVITAGDLVRGGTGVPAGMMQYKITFPRPLEALGIPGPQDVGTVPRINVPPPPPPQPRPAVPLPDPQVGGGSYQVRRGDSMWTIATKVYGDGTQWTKIAAANPQITNPNVIYAGQVLHLPVLSTAQLHPVG